MLLGIFGRPRRRPASGNVRKWATRRKPLLAGKQKLAAPDRPIGAVSGSVPRDAESRSLRSSFSAMHDKTCAQ